MVDYKLIADNDPNPSGSVDAENAGLISAFESMKLQTNILSQKRKISFLDIADYIDVITASKFSTAVKNNLDEWIYTLLTKKGIDITSPKSQTAVNSLVAAEPAFEQTDADAIIALANQTEEKFKRFKLGHLQNARRMKRVADEDPGGLITQSVVNTMKLSLGSEFNNLRKSEVLQARRKRQSGKI